jgi:hypothetical protein
MFLFPLCLVTVLAWDRHKNVSIPALSSNAPPSYHLYPVRMLTIYVDRTRNAHPVKILERLFVLKRVPLTFLVRLYHFGYILRFVLFVSLQRKNFLPVTQLNLVKYMSLIYL